jgi:hypothetical protein
MSNQAPTDAIPARSAAAMRRTVRAGAFAAFAALIWLGPFASQILQIKHPLLRPWTMFSGVGVGILKGEFLALADDGAVTRLTPLQVLGRDRYPVTRSTEFPLRIGKIEDLRSFAARFCETRSARLSFDGRVGGYQGWQALQADDICARPGHESR